MDKDRNKKIDTTFLGFRIKNTGNNDGYILIGDTDKELWRSHLGNYGSLEDAQEAALFYFMLDRPNYFASTLCRMALYGHDTHLEYNILSQALVNSRIEMPKEITPDGTSNYGILLNGKPFTDRGDNEESGGGIPPEVMAEVGRAMSKTLDNELNKLNKKLTK